MDMLRQSLAISPEAREAFEREERAHFRKVERMLARGAEGEERVAAANAKRDRRKARNLIHSLKISG